MRDINPVTSSWALSLDNADIICDDETSTIYRTIDDHHHPWLLKTLNTSLDADTQLHRLEKENSILKHLSGIDGVVRPAGLTIIQDQPTLILHSPGDHTVQEWWNSRTSSNAVYEQISLLVHLAETIAQLHSREVIHGKLSLDPIFWNQKSGHPTLINFSHAYFRDTSLDQEDIQVDLIELGKIIQALANYSKSEGIPKNSHQYPKLDAIAGRLVHPDLVHRYPSANHLLSDLLQYIKRPMSFNRSHDNSDLATEELLSHLETSTLDSPVSPTKAEIKISEAISNSLQGIARSPLYGRELELGRLVRIIATSCVNNYGTHLAVVQGPHGIGKTALIKHALKHIPHPAPRVAWASCDHHDNEASYGAIIHGLRNLCKSITFPKETHLSELIHSNLEVITQVIPSLKQSLDISSIGSLPFPPESELRLRKALLSLIEGLATEQHPLFIVLDDIQWIDQASITLIEDLVYTRISHVTVIGACNNKFINHHHQLKKSLQTFIASGTPIQPISLTRLKPNNIHDLLQDLTGHDSDDLAELTKIFCDRTLGNPRSISNLLASLKQKNLLFYNSKSRKWHWDIQEIRALQEQCEDVFSLENSSLEFDEDLEKFLKTAACIGLNFDIYFVAQTNNISIKKAKTLAAKLVQLNYIEPINPNNTNVDSKNYNFKNHQTFQHIHNTTSLADRTQRHESIGRHMMTALSNGRTNISAAEICNQINRTFLNICSPSESLRRGHLNYEAGAIAISSFDFYSAAKYFSAGIEWVLKYFSWEEHPELLFRLHFHLAQATYAEGLEEEALLAIKELLERPVNIELKSLAYASLINKRTSRLEFDQAISLGLEALVALGYQPPIVDQEATINELDAKIGTLMFNQTPSGLLGRDHSCPQAVEGVHLILEAMYEAARFGDAVLLGLLARFGTILSLEQGSHRTSVIHYAYYAAMLAQKDNPQASKWSTLAYRLSTRDRSQELLAKVTNIIGSFVLHRFDGHESSIRSLIESSKLSRDIGDWNHALQSSLHLFNAYLYTGKNLKQLADLLDETLSISHHNYQLQPYLELCHQFIDTLLGKESTLSQTREMSFNNTPLPEIYIDKPFFVYDHLAKKLFLMLLFHPGKQTYHLARTCVEGCPKALLNSHTAIRCQLYFGLAICDWWSFASVEERICLEVELELQSDVIYSLTRANESCLEHTYYLFLAESARVRQRSMEYILKNYDLAIRTAQSLNQHHEAAMAAERALLFVSRQSLHHIAAEYFRLAIHNYQEWGAIAKLKDLHHQFGRSDSFSVENYVSAPLTQTPNKAHSSGDTLLQDIFEDARTLISETHLEQLVGVIVQVFLEHSGVQYSCLLVTDQPSIPQASEPKREIRVQATCRVGEAPSQVMANIPLSQWDELPITIIEMVEHTRVPIICSKPSHFHRYSHDAYLQREQPKFSICLPMLNRGEVIGLIYLEDHKQKSLSDINLDALDLLIIQATTALLHAQNYKTHQNEIYHLNSSYSQLENAYGYIYDNFHQSLEITQTSMAKLSKHLIKIASDPSDSNHINLAHLEVEQLLLHLQEMAVSSEVSDIQPIRLQQKPIHVERLLEQSLELLSPLLRTKPDIKLETDIRIYPKIRYVDGHRLRQLVLKLLSNGLKYTRKGHVRLSALSKDVNVYIVVTDTGRGIPSEQLETLFETTSTSTSVLPSQSISIPLTQVKRLVTAMGGEILVQSQVEVGSVFTIYIPLAISTSQEIPEFSSQRNSLDNSQTFDSI